MKRKLLVCVTLLMCLTNFVACANANNTTQVETESTTVSDTSQATTVEDTTTTETIEQTDEMLTANDVLTYLQEKCSNIGNYVEYTEETDTNQLLGRPNQYTSKINVADTRVEQTNPDDPIGFSIEVFSNSEDALARQEYIGSIIEQMPMMSEYDYINDYILIRVNKSLTPSQAEEYENALKEIFN